MKYSVIGVIGAAMLTSASVLGIEATDAQVAGRPGLCMTRETADKMLAQRFGEHPVLMARSTRKHVLIVYGNPTSGTWTAFIGDPTNGLFCAVDAGGSLALRAAGDRAS